MRAVVGPASAGLDELVLVISDDAGTAEYAAPLRPGSSGDAVDAELAALGWARTGPWRPAPGAGARGADDEGRTGRRGARVRALPRCPVTPADRQVLQALVVMTRMAGGPVTGAALVPHAAPRWQAAAVVLRRLVAAGQVRVVGRTGGRICRCLYAPVGSPWAPEREGGGGAGAAAGRDRDGGRDEVAGAARPPRPRAARTPTRS